MPTTGAATQTNVSTQPVDEPLLAAAWVGATQLDDVAQSKRDDRRLVCGHYSSPRRLEPKGSCMAAARLSEVRLGVAPSHVHHDTDGQEPDSADGNPKRNQ